MPTHRFVRKLQGAQARLFAAVCEHYIDAVNDPCNDKPEDVPMFSRLSPQQRLSLVKDVMVGLLCGDEPLPPNTIQHGAAYTAMVSVLYSEILVEEEMCEGDFRDELVNIGEEFQCQRGRGRQLTEEEIAERQTNWHIVEATALRNKRAFEKKNKPVETFKVDENKLPSWQKVYERATRILFGGPPIPIEERRSLLLSLNDDERGAFRWRILADEALQENTHVLGRLPPLCCVDFDWRCGNLEKWNEALNYLLSTHGCYQATTETEWELVWGAINSRSYADPAQHPRIRAVDKNVAMLRVVYEKKWKPESVGDDQRCMWALSAKEPYWTEDHAPWAKAFLVKCLEKGISFSKRGDFQKRFDVYQELKPIHADADALKKLFTYGGYFPETPSEYEDELTDLHSSCNGPRSRVYRELPGCREISKGISCLETENLMQCSGCGVVRYCSRRCQKNDWGEHKKVCKAMALLKKDKKKVAELAKKL